MYRERLLIILGLTALGGIQAHAAFAPSLELSPASSSASSMRSASSSAPLRLQLSPVERPATIPPPSPSSSAMPSLGTSRPQLTIPSSASSSSPPAIRAIVVPTNTVTPLRPQLWSAPRGASSSSTTMLTQPVGLVPVRNLMKERVIYLLNAERGRKNLGALRWNARLDAAAQAHAEDMLRRRYISHSTLEGLTPLDRIQRAGYKPSSCNCTYSMYYGENIGWGQSTADLVMSMWMASPDHRAHILEPRFAEVGIGIAEKYWVLDFGGITYGVVR